MANPAYFNGSNYAAGVHYITHSLKVNSQDIAGNRSNITITLTMTEVGNYGSWTSEGRLWNIKVGGVEKASGYKQYDFRSGARTITLGSWTGLVDHANDGSLSLAVSGYFNSYHFGTATTSQTHTLTKIPRGHTFTVSNFTITATGFTLPVKIDKSYNAYSSWLSLYIGDTYIGYWYTTGSGNLSLKHSDMANNTAAQAISKVLNAIPNSTSKVATLRCYTMTGPGDNDDIARSDKSLTISVHKDVKPGMGNIAVTETNSLVKTTLGLGYFVQGVSTFSVTVGNVVPGEGATVKSRAFKLGGWDTVSGAAASQAFGASSQLAPKVIATITDSRNRVTSKELTLAQTPYSKPTITLFKASRYDQVNQAKVHIDLKAVQTSLKVGVTEKNTIRYKVDARPETSQVWEQKKAWSSYQTGDFNLSATVISDIPNDGKWRVRVTVEDRVGTQSTLIISLDFSKKTIVRVTDGSLWEFLGLAVDVNGDLKARSNAEVFGLYGLTHAYMGLYANGTNRTAFMGQASPDNKNLYISNETSGADILLSTTGSGKIRANGEEVLTFPPTNSNVNFNTFTEPGFHYFSRATNGPEGSSSAGWYAIIIKASAGHVVQFTLRTSTALSNPLYIRRGVKSDNNVDWGPWGQITLGAV